MFERVLVVGAGGQLAHALMDAAPAGTHCLGRMRAELDICDAAALEETLAELKPLLVINGAAYNQVDLAEGEGMEEALRVNALGVGRLAAACRQAEIPLVHFSTDLVFDGEQREPYTESDCPRPLSVYGASKLAGEHLALAASPRNFVIRVCRLFGPTGSVNDGSLQKRSGNFPLLMLRLAKERGFVRVVNDQIGSPTYLPDLAAAIWQLLETAPGGLYQLANSGEVSFADYARAVFDLAGIACDIDAVSSIAYGAPARRPLYSTLSSQKALDAGVKPLRHWRDALAAFMSTQK